MAMTIYSKKTEEKKGMDNRAKHQAIVTKAGKIVAEANKNGMVVAARKFGISTYGVYVAKAVMGEHVPSGTLKCIVQDNPTMAAKKAKTSHAKPVLKSKMNKKSKSR
jgi:hypothetical protein